MKIKIHTEGADMLRAELEQGRSQEDPIEASLRGERRIFGEELKKEFEKRLNEVMEMVRAKLEEAFAKRREGLKNLAQQEPSVADPGSVVEIANQSVEDKWKNIKANARAKLHLEKNK